MMSAAPDSQLIGEIRDYLRAHAGKNGRLRTAATFGVSRHTLWRFLDHDQQGT